MRRRPAVAVLVVLPVLLLAGCAGGSGSGDDALPERLQRISPTDPAPSTFTPVTRAPLDFRTLTGKHYRISVPADWTDRPLAPPTKDGVPGVAASAAGTEPGKPVSVAVVVDALPRSDAIEQSQVLAVTKSTQGVKDLTRSEVPWPGTQRAILITWTQPQSGSGEVFRTEQLMAQVSSSLIVNVVGVAPESEFHSTEVDKVVRSLVVSP